MVRGNSLLGNNVVYLLKSIVLFLTEEERWTLNGVFVV